MSFEASALEADVRWLAEQCPGRNLMWPKVLEAAAGWVETRLASMGYEVRREPFEVAGRPCRNLVAELPGTERPEQRFVVGAHYDTVGICPGADDNASGLAALLALAAWFRERPLPVTVRLVAFVNEEPPNFHSEGMGSLVHARRMRADGLTVVGMWSLDSLGYYREQPFSQRYPGPVRLNPLYLALPNRGNFVSFVGNRASAALVRSSRAAFGAASEVPARGLVARERVPGVGYSDHWSFWQVGWPALLVTDTAQFRNPHYHQPTDTPETLDFAALARVTAGLARALPALGWHRPPGR